MCDDSHTMNFRVFIASPSDVLTEREAAFEVIKDVNRTLDNRQKLCQLQVYKWENIPPDIGYPEEVIFRQIPIEKCDVFIAIFWKRLGTPTGSVRPTDGRPYLSGTEEELEKAIQTRKNSANHRPLIMLYRKMDPIPAEMNDEDFHQFDNLRGYFKKFAPAGEHPALIVSFRNDEFKNRLREDLLSIVSRFLNEQSSFGLSTPNLQPSIAMQGNIDNAIVIAGENNQITVAQPMFRGPLLPQSSPTLTEESDNESDWLQEVGLRNNPFRVDAAEREEQLPGYFVSPPNLRPSDFIRPVKPIVVFGDIGRGKTALRIAVESYAYPRKPQAAILAVSFGLTEFEMLLEQVNNSLDALTTAHFAHVISQLINSQVHIEQVSTNGAVHSLNYCLDTIARLTTTAGFEHTLCLVDQVDSLHLLQSQPDLAAGLLKPLMALEIRQARHLTIHYFLPRCYESLLTSQPPLFRLDRCDVRSLSWTPTALQRLIQQRMTFFSADPSKAYRSIGQLCESADRFADTIDTEIATLACGNPRAVLWLTNHLIRFHCRDDKPSRLIRAATWREVKDIWLLEGRPLFFDEAGYWLQDEDIYFQTRQVFLSAASHALMRCLIEADGRICRRPELIKLGWPDIQIDRVSDKMVSEAIYRLKNELKRQGLDPKSIKNVRGQGYRVPSARYPASASDEVEGEE
jgi:DNA-binding winged helix-turn-helix (wHTH) protein